MTMSLSPGGKVCLSHFWNILLDLVHCEASWQDALETEKGLSQRILNEDPQ